MSKFLLWHSDSSYVTDKLRKGLHNLYFFNLQAVSFKRTYKVVVYNENMVNFVNYQHIYSYYVYIYLKIFSVKLKICEAETGYKLHTGLKAADFTTKLIPYKLASFTMLAFSSWSLHVKKFIN